MTTELTVPTITLPACGVSPELYHEHKFDNHVWYHNADLRDWLTCTKVLIQIGKNYWIKDPSTSVWKEYQSKSDAKNIFISYYGNSTKVLPPSPNGQPAAIDSDLAEILFNGTNRDIKTHIGTIPQIDGTMTLPYGPEYITITSTGLHYLNLWRDTFRKPDINADLTLGYKMLALIWGSLTASGNIDRYDDMSSVGQRLHENILANNWHDWSDFKFLMMFLAKIYQRPGVNLQVNIVMSGPQGSGKGTLLRCIRTVFNNNNMVSSLSKSEIAKRGWNDFIENRLIVEVNEFDRSYGNFDWNAWVKETCNETYVSIAQRNKSLRVAINTANYIFCSNEEKVMNIDKTDRRNHFIKNSDLPHWTKFSQMLNRDIDGHERELAVAFATILSTVVVDDLFISRAQQNDFRTEMLMDSIDYWIENDDEVEKHFNRAILVDDLWNMYHTFYSRAEEAVELKKSQFIRKLKSNRGTFETPIGKGTSMKTKIKRPPPSTTHTNDGIRSELFSTDATPQPIQYNSERGGFDKLLEMRKQLQSKI